MIENFDISGQSGRIKREEGTLIGNAGESLVVAGLLANGVNFWRIQQ